MKTLTEFPALNLKNAAKTKQDLIANGKSTEEIPQAMGESLKLEGERLGFLLNALELVGTKLNDLKRTVVYALNEGEKAPQGAIQKGDHFYLVEYYPPLEREKPKGDSQNNQDGKRRKKRGRNRNNDRRPPGDDRPRSPSLSADGTPSADNSSHPPKRRPRFPKKDQENKKPVITPKN